MSRPYEDLYQAVANAISEAEWHMQYEILGDLEDVREKILALIYPNYTPMLTNPPQSL